MAPRFRRAHTAIARGLRMTSTTTSKASSLWCSILRRFPRRPWRAQFRENRFHGRVILPQRDRKRISLRRITFTTLLAYRQSLRREMRCARITRLALRASASAKGRQKRARISCRKTRDGCGNATSLQAAHPHRPTARQRLVCCLSGRSTAQERSPQEQRMSRYQSRRSRNPKSCLLEQRDPRALRR